jgi:hypothetical protein
MASPNMCFYLRLGFQVNRRSERLYKETDTRIILKNDTWTHQRHFCHLTKFFFSFPVKDDVQNWRKKKGRKIIASSSSPFSFFHLFILEKSYESLISSCCKCELMIKTHNILWNLMEAWNLIGLVSWLMGNRKN